MQHKACRPLVAPRLILAALEKHHCSHHTTASSCFSGFLFSYCAVLTSPMEWCGKDIEKATRLLLPEPAERLQWLRSNWWSHMMTSIISTPTHSGNDTRVVSPPPGSSTLDHPVINIKLGRLIWRPLKLKETQTSLHLIRNLSPEPLWDPGCEPGCEPELLEPEELPLPGLGTSFSTLSQSRRGSILLVERRV